MHCWPQHILPRNDTHHLFPLSSSYSRDFRLCHSFNRITKLITHAVITTFLALETKKEMKNSFTWQRSTNLFARVACTSFSLSISIYSIYIFLFLSVSMTERGGNMKRAPSLSTNSPSGRRWTTNEKSEKERETKGGERREREKEGGVFPTWRLNVWHDCEQAQVGTCLGLRKGERASRRSAFRGRSMTSREFASNYRVSVTYSSLSLTHPSLFLFHFLPFFCQCSFRSSCFMISISFLLFSFYFIYFKFHFKW